jgi:hypothetical protein
MKNYIVALLCVLTCSLAGFAQKDTALLTADICIYGGTSSGVIAAYTARKMGKTVILIEPGRHLGGMSSGGLGYTDIGNKYVVTGLARDFYRRIGAHYGKFEQWIFEPGVAEAIFNDYVKRAGFPVLLENRLLTVKKEGNQVKEITLEKSHQPAAATNKRVRAKVFMDCTYEGDLMARSGVSYAVGREANDEYKETINGVELMDGHQFPDSIDPYVVPGDPKTGLLWGISDQTAQANGTGNKMVQAYNFRITLTNVPENRIPISRPANYDPTTYALLLRLKEKQPWKTLTDVFIWSLMPNGKTDINNKGGFSTDMIGMNWEYPEAGYDKRAQIWKEHEEYTKGLLYFIGNDPRIPEHIRNEMKQWGYPADEYTDNGNWSHQLYIREARRMIGELVMTEHHCQGSMQVTDGVGMAAYGMDSHNCERLVINGQVKNEGNVEVHGFAPYAISYRAIIPRQKEVENLFVPVCLSATHIAYGSIRMEPVFMVLGQSSAIAACQAIDEKIPVQQVNVKAVQTILKNNPLADGSTPEILVDNEDSALVRITGNWKTEKNGGYGPTWLTHDPGAGIAGAVLFNPKIIKTGDYQVYAYFPKVPNASTLTHITIYDGENATEKTINLSDLRVEGQTAGEWVALGKYKLVPGKKAYVEVSDKNADGVIVADAVLFVPVPDGMLNIKQTVAGNIFYEKENKAFVINTDGDSVEWVYYDYWNKEIASGSSPVVGGTVGLTVNPGKLGWFRLILTARKNGRTLASKETSFAIVSDFDLGTVKESPFIGQTHAWQSIDTLIPIAKKMGVKYIRDVIRWEAVENAKQVYTFKEKQDRFISLLAENNLKPYLVLALYNPLYDKGEAPVSKEAVLAFANYGRQVLSRYPSINQVEIWNEPDIGTFSKGLTTEEEKAAFYFNLLKASYELIHPLFPAVKITGFVTSDRASDAFLNSIYKKGALKYMNEYAFHSYTPVPEDIVKDIARHKAIMRSWNADKTIPLNLSETGFTTFRFTETEQANYLPRRIVNALANGVGKIGIYNLQNKSTKRDSEGSFGLIRHPDDSNGAYVPKPAFVAYAVLTRQLTGAKFQREEQLSPPGIIYSFKFTKGDEEIRCMYSPSGARVKLHTAASIAVTDLMGNKKIYTPANGIVYLNLDKDLVYVIAIKPIYPATGSKSILRITL